MPENTSEFGAIDPRDPYLAIFFIDVSVMPKQIETACVREITRRGFELTANADLPQADKVLKSQLASAGLEIDVGGRRAMVALDIMPSHMDAPAATFRNKRIVAVLRGLMGRFREHAGPEAPSPVEVVDGPMAWDILEHLLPGQRRLHLERLAGELEAIALEPAVRDLTNHGNRSRTELILWRGQLAIRKIFRPTSLQFMRREVEVCEKMGATCPAIAQLLEVGPNFVVTEFVSEGSPAAPDLGRPRPLPLTIVRELAAFVKLCVANGFDPVDHSPRNNILFTKTGFRIIDCEFWRRCDPALPPELSLCLAGVVEDADDLPAAEWTRHPYERRWLPYTCLDLHSFLYDPPWLQALKRPLVIARLALARPARRLSRLVPGKQRLGR